MNESESMAGERSAATESSQTVQVLVEADSCINFAMQQNDVPIVKRLRVENGLDRPLADLWIRIDSDPPFMSPWEVRVERIPERATYEVPSFDLSVSPSYLATLSERLLGHLNVSVLEGEDRIASRSVALEVLARNEWGGLRSLPEILAAFVMPNHPAMQDLLREAADLLLAAGSESALSGYQTRSPRRVYQMVSAAYQATAARGITYINPPASFEQEGQRIRLPSEVLGARMGTCLDLSSLIAGCLEQMGLHPLLILLDGHAMVGVWLDETSFPVAVVDDALSVRKRVELDELVVFDTTCMTSNPPMAFERSVSEAKTRLEATEAFAAAIDIHRARVGQIRPLPVQGPADRAPDSGTSPASSGDLPDALHLPDSTRSEAPKEEEAPKTRLDRWRTRLLDLSMNNRLLAFRTTKKTMPLLCHDLGQLEDLLAGGATITLAPRPREMSAGEPRDPEAFRRRTGEEALDRLLTEELEAKRLYTGLSETEMTANLVALYREDRTHQEEGGASALYLGLGFLSWYETAESEKRRLSPLLLLPLTLERASLNESFKIRAGTDEPRINVTLLELLKRDFGMTIAGLDPLPEDDSGLDVPLILRRFREAVREVPRWEVLDVAHIGIFSFAKFLLWRDLTERYDTLLENPVVRHLVERSGEEYGGEQAFPDVKRLDEEHPPTSVFCPLPTDSSQLAAVLAAAQGKTFVLQGPPGTGKSQTITNLVSHCLAQGKTVLFVSEKMAALEVVHDRLVQVGLGPFVLELHSKKASKSDVYRQLDESRRGSRSNSPDEWERAANRLSTLRADLNEYANQLHEVRECGESVFSATSKLTGLRDAPRVALQWASPESVGVDELARMKTVVEQLVTANQALGGVAQSPWSAAQRREYSPGWESEVGSAVEQMSSTLATLAEKVRTATSVLGIDGTAFSEIQLEALDCLCKAMISPPSLPAALVCEGGWQEIRSTINTWVTRGRRRDELRAAFGAAWSRSLLRADLSELQVTWAQSQQSWWPVSVFRRRHVRGVLRKHARGRVRPASDEVPRLLAAAIELKALETELSAAEPEGNRLLGSSHWRGGEADWEDVESVRQWADTLRSTAATLSAGDLILAGRMRQHWVRLADETTELLQPSGPGGIALGQLRDSFEQVREARRNLTELLRAEPGEAWGDPSTADAVVRWRRTTLGWESHLHQLAEWCHWLRAKADALSLNLGPLAEALASDHIEANQLSEVFEHSFLSWWRAAVLDRQPVLAEFVSLEHQRKIDDFRKTDDQYTELTRSLLADTLARRVPQSGSADVPDAEIGLLTKETKKKRRHLALRQLFQHIPNLLPRLKPCLLMSPMSVAQYLSADHPSFDLVVFDEASQIPVWDAVGVLARAKQAVIVGDPKQLPPTTFFQRSEDDSEEDAELEDLESILDDCIAARIPTLDLNWHYRSRHESLITFSNYHYYGNRLLTFPSADTEGRGVRWHYVQHGIYDRGKSRTNRREAEAVVEEIVRRLRDPDLSLRSMGVVTFNQAQRDLIEDLLEARRREDKEIESYFSRNAREALFVKNLENVQGDERDVILFSITYGKDAQSRPSMNFGPMNREGGERRLNVAATRAKQEVLVFSSLRAEEIDLSRSRARGVRDLKNFLEYAARGVKALAEASVVDTNADFDSPFEEQVHEALSAKGWVVHKQVGCSGYRIDLAVVDPDFPGRYLLGVECDGANYHRSKTARDRDKLRESVLRGLGWEIYRIWSSDWWRNPERERDRALEAIERAVEGARASRIP